MRSLLIQVLLVFLALPAAAEWSKTPSKHFEIAEPLPLTSIEISKEIETLLAHQKSDRKEDCAVARDQLHPSFHVFFEDFAPLDGQDISRFEPLIEKVIKFTTRVATYHKNQHKRPRPNQADKRIKPCIATPGGQKSYPSSHAAAGMSSACVLAHIFSDQSEELLNYGKYLGDLRFIGGVHFPSDVVAGQELGSQICNFLLEDSDFLKDVEAIL